MEFHTVRNESGRLIMTPTRWIEKMNAIGITSKAGKYGGTYASDVDVIWQHKTAHSGCLENTHETQKHTYSS